MSTLVIRQPVHRQTPTPPPQDEDCIPTIASKSRVIPIPNKHIPYCSPGPIPAQRGHQVPATPPDSPPSKQSGFQGQTLLQDVGRFPQVAGVPPVYSIEVSDLAAAVHELSTQLLPEPKQLFPWLHGLSAENQVQLAFFSIRRRLQRSMPKCFRGITIVKVGGDLSRAKLKSAISPEEILESSPTSDLDARFIDLDPREGFSIRNFQIQCTKMAVMSDLVIYRDQTATDRELHLLARKFSIAQENWRLASRGADNDHSPRYSTFILRDSFAAVETSYPELVAIDSKGTQSTDITDFSLWERQEMSEMSKMSEIAHNVWLGPTPNLDPPGVKQFAEQAFDIVIEATDSAVIPGPHQLKRIGQMSANAQQFLELPASGSLVPASSSRSEADPLLYVCRWIHRLTNPLSTHEDAKDEVKDADGDIPMKSLPPRPRKILIHCADGYTETTLLALAYFMYAERVPLHTAMLRLHSEKNRNFFAYPSDIPVLTSLQPHILASTEKSMHGGKRTRATSIKLYDEPPWLARIDGSLPSRILPHMYLGNLLHANNTDLLKAMGIGQILSVGEPVSWNKGELEAWGQRNVMMLNDIQDNGVDSLMTDFDRCLTFIARGALAPKPTATLVHCRVGVSRSATICIAAVMSTLHLSFPRAYCFVRARRLNVIIQPHLRFAYELMKWDEICQLRRGEPVRRDIDWACVAREIGRLNAPYSSK